MYYHDLFYVFFYLFFFFFNDTATTEIYTLSLHDALPISRSRRSACRGSPRAGTAPAAPSPRSEEHTSELQSSVHLVCRLLLEKKNQPRDRMDQQPDQPGRHHPPVDTRPSLARRPPRHEHA